MHQREKSNKHNEVPASGSASEPSFLDQLRLNHAQPKHEIESHDTNTTQIEATLSRDDHPKSDTANNTNSEMPPEARRALVSLLRQGVILCSQKAKLFESLCRYQSAVRRHLAEVYLKLVLDKKAGVAFVASIQSEDEADTEGFDDGEIVSLISRRRLSLYDTLLLLVLRKHYQERETSGEQRIVIDTERVESYLTPFLPLTNSTKSDRKKLNSVLDKMVEKKLLSSVKGSEDRFEITPVIRYVVSAEFLESMLNEYIKIAQENAIAAHDVGASQPEGNALNHQSAPLCDGENDVQGGHHA